MTSDYQSGASAMREMAAVVACTVAIENYRPLLGHAIMKVIRDLPLPADPVSSEGADRRLHEARVHKADIAEIERQMDVSIAARDAEIATLRAALEKANDALVSYAACAGMPPPRVRQQGHEARETLAAIKQTSK